MSAEFYRYMTEHRTNVCEAYEWLIGHDVIKSINADDTIFDHDQSKYSMEEFDAYDRYFYGRGNCSFKEFQDTIFKDFEVAWLHHIHHNPHHWQHWVLMHDEPGEKTTALEMPYECVVEMICDWWSFSWKSGNLYEIFKWYEKHKEHMLLNPKTRSLVEAILRQMKMILDKEQKAE